MELRKYVRQLGQGRIAETPYVQEKLDEVVTLLSRGQVVFLHGETGTGKTETALLAGRAASGGREPLLIRGYKGMTSEELFGHMTLTSSDLVSASDRAEAINKKLAEYKNHLPNSTADQDQDFLKNALLQSGSTITQYILGSVYRAANEGRTLIIDEANYIPPELLAKMNSIFTKRPGEKIDVQEDGIGPITVKEGFGIILTGNINPDPKDPRYQGRARFDLAFEDRIQKVSYYYLPQATEGDYQNFGPEEKQLFTVVLSSLLAPYRPDLTLSKEERVLESIENRHGSLYLPGGERGLRDIFRLCKLAAVTQKAFAGEIEASSEFAHQENGVRVKYRPEVALSPRVVMGLLDDWKKDGFQRELDYYLTRALIDRATKFADKEYLYQLGQKFNFFQSEKNWPATVDGLRNRTPTNRGAAVEFVPGRAVIEAIYGPAPTRTVWPEGREIPEEEVAQDTAFEAMELQGSFAALLKEVRETRERYSFLAPQEETPKDPAEKPQV